MTIAPRRAEGRSAWLEMGPSVVNDGVEVAVPAGSGYWSDVVARVRAWWDASTFLGEVALVFTLVTVGNSVMMLTGLDEPKTGSFAYVHLLGRLGVITFLVGLFYLDEIRGWFVRWRRHPPHPGSDRPRRSMRSVVETLRGSVPRGGLDVFARVYTTVVAETCLIVVAVAEIRPPVGGRGLYRNLVLLALVLLPTMFAARRRELRRTSA
jgi:hypothetical protein